MSLVGSQSFFRFLFLLKLWVLFQYVDFVMYAGPGWMNLVYFLAFVSALERFLCSFGFSSLSNISKFYYESHRKYNVGSRE